MKLFQLSLVGLLALSLPAWADSTPAQMQSSESVSVTQKPLTPEQRKQLNAAAVRVLNKIADTRFAIRMKNYDVAKSDIDQANTALGMVSNLSPTATVRDSVDLARKHIDYQTTSRVVQDLVPVTTGLDEISDYVPTAQAKQHLNNAKQSLANGDKAKAKSELKDVSDALVYREVDLPITATQVQIDKARTDLHAGHPTAADTALKTAENSMPVFESAVVSSGTG